MSVRTGLAVERSVAYADDCAMKGEVKADQEIIVNTANTTHQEAVR